MTHPQRCETCQHREEYYPFGHNCPMRHYTWSPEQIESITMEIGCASHSSAPSGTISTLDLINREAAKHIPSKQSIRQDEREKYEQQIKKWATTGFNKNTQKIKVQSLLFYLKELRTQGEQE